MTRDNPTFSKSNERNILRELALGSIAGAAIGACIINHQGISRVIEAHDGLSDAEKTVSESISYITDTDMTVLCDGDLPDNAEGGKSYRTQGYVVPIGIARWHYTPDIITLRPEHCENIADAVAAKDLTPQAARSLLIATHEVGHTQNPSASEAEVQCRAVALLSSQLGKTGLSADEAASITKNTAHDFYRLQPPQYKDDMNCQPGGKYVVDLELDGISPIIYYNQTSVG